MPSASEDNGTFEIYAPLSWRARLAFLIGGLACILLPASTLWRAVLQPSWWSLLPAILILFAGCAGIVLILGSLAGESLHWTIRDGVVTQHRASRFGGAARTFAAAEIKQVAARLAQRDPGGSGYCVALQLSSGEWIELPASKTTDDAEALAKDIRRQLSIRLH